MDEQIYVHVCFLSGDIAANYNGAYEITPLYNYTDTVPLNYA